MHYHLSEGRIAHDLASGAHVEHVATRTGPLTEDEARTHLARRLAIEEDIAASDEHAFLVGIGNGARAWIVAGTTLSVVQCQREPCLRPVMPWTDEVDRG